MLANNYLTGKARPRATAGQKINVKYSQRENIGTQLAVFVHEEIIPATLATTN